MTTEEIRKLMGSVGRGRGPLWEAEDAIRHQRARRIFAEFRAWNRSWGPELAHRFLEQRARSAGDG